MTLKESHMAKPRKERPTLWTLDAEAAQRLGALHPRRPQGQGRPLDPVKGVKMCDTYTEGRWTFVFDGPHRGARIMEIFEVRNRSELSLDMQGISRNIVQTPRCVSIARRPRFHKSSRWCRANQ